MGTKGTLSKVTKLTLKETKNEVPEYKTTKKVHDGLRQGDPLS